jgi:exopolysaccharide biosynthesis polyprenyl glycosylphosphotransferase
MTDQTAASRAGAAPRMPARRARGSAIRRRLRAERFVTTARLSGDAGSIACAALVAQATAEVALPTWVLALAALAILGGYAAAGLYRSGSLAPRLGTELLTVLWVPALVTMAVAAGELAASGPADGPVRFWLLTAAMTATSRLALHGAQALLRRSATDGNTLIVGAGQVGHLAAKRLLEDPALGMRPIGFLDKEPLDVDHTLPVLGASYDLEQVVRDHDVEHLLVAFSTAPPHVLLDIVRRSWALGVTVMVVPRLYEVEGRRAWTEHLGALPIITLDPPRPHSWPFAVKYALDRVVAAVALAALAPLLAVVAVAILVDSGRPILFRQKRVGLDGRVFEMLKFRTMRGTPEAGGELDAEWAAMATGGGAPPDSAAHTDDRRTRLGSALRKLSIDELPQLWNVLRGDMSIVGPRPERLHYVELFEQSIDRYPERHRVKSGLTGWSQVNGLRGETSLEDRVEWDNFYIENWSPWLDLKILFKTIPALAAGDGTR